MNNGGKSVSIEVSKDALEKLGFLMGAGAHCGDVHHESAHCDSAHCDSAHCDSAHCDSAHCDSTTS